MKITFISVSRFVMSVVLPLLMFPLVYLLQIALGHEMSLFPLYMIPVALLSWDFGVKGVLVGTVFAIFFWIAANVASGQQYSLEWYRYFNAGVRGLIYALTGAVILFFKRTLETHRKRMEAMREMLNICHGCGAVQGSDGEWIPMDKLQAGLKKNSHECPACAQIAKR